MVSMIKNFGMLLVVATSGTALAEELTDENLDLADPNVRSYGYDYKLASTDGNMGVDLRANFDLGASYEAPMYSQAQYYTTR